MSPTAEPRGVPAAVERVRAHLARLARAAAALWALAAAAGVLALAWWLAGPDGWAQGTAWPLALDLTLGVVAAALALWLRASTRRLADERLARAMESSAGLEAGTVVGALELARAVPAGVSRSLAGLAERGVAARLQLPEGQLSGALGTRALRWTRWSGAALAVAAPLAALLLVAAPARSRDAWAGLARPVRLMAPAVLPPLVVTPGDAEVPRGTPFTVSVQAPGRAGVTLHWQAAGDVARSSALAVEDDRAEYRFASVGSRVAYSFTTADGAKSPTYTLTPLDPLLVGDVSLELTFPPYTGRAPEEYHGEAPPLVVPEGTRVRIEGRATRRLSAAALERADGRRVALAAEGAGFAGSWVPTGTGIYAWRFRDLEGAEAEAVPAPLDLTVVADSAPTIRFSYPGADTTLPINLRQPLVIELRDDYGLNVMELVAYRVTSLGERRAPVVQSADLEGTRGALARPMLDVSGWGLLPGDTVRYFARVLDNSPVPHAAETREYALRMPEASELRRGAQRELESMTARLQDLAERARRAGEQARDLERESGSRSQLSAENRATAQLGRRGEADRAGFENREALKRAIEEQQAMSAEAERAKSEVQALDQALREAASSDPQLQKDLEELAQLLEQAASPELRERLAQMGDKLDGVDPRQMRQTLDQLAAQQERFREQLQQSLEQLRRASAAQDFRATTEDARELAQREQALADALREGDQPALRREQQAELRKEAGELSSHLDQLRERLESLAEADSKSGVEQAREETSEAEQAMERAQEAIGAQPQSGSQPRGAQPEPPRPSPEAAAQADQAGEALQRAADKLEDARQDLSNERAQQLQQAVSQAGEQALALARGQAEVRDDMRTAGRDGMAGLLGDEAAIKQGLENIAGSLQAAGSDAPELRSMGERIQSATGAVEQTLRAMEGQRGVLTSPQASADNAVKALNALAMAALSAGEQMAQSGGQGDMTQQLQELAQQQGQLNNRAGQVPPLQLGRQAMGEQLQQLSDEQGQVAQDLQGLAKRPAAKSEALGDLQALADEARDLADRLAGGRLDAETRERQERLFHHLLDAGRTLERDDQVSNERQARTAGAFEGAVVQPLGADALGVLKFALPPSEELMRLTPAERELVLRYFDRLNRGAGSGPPEAKK